MPYEVDLGPVGGDSPKTYDLGTATMQTSSGLSYLNIPNYGNAKTDFTNLFTDIKADITKDVTLILSVDVDDGFSISKQTMHLHMLWNMDSYILYFEGLNSNTQVKCNINKSTRKLSFESSIADWNSKTVTIKARVI